MKVTKLISDNSPKIIKKAVNTAEKETAKVLQTSPQMSTARADLEWKAETMPAEDYIRMRTYLAELEMESMLRNSIF